MSDTKSSSLDHQRFFLEQYASVRIIGRGAHGIVMLSQKKDLAKEEDIENASKLCVIKQIYQDFVEPQDSSQAQLSNFHHDGKSEVRILAMLRHPNIIRYFDSNSSYCHEDRQGRPNGSRCFSIVMEYANAGSLSEYLQATTEFLSLEVIGTPNYLAPELCHGSVYDETCDIWAMGCILHEILTKKPMFEAPNLLALIKKITQRIPSDEPIPASAPSWLTILINRMTDLDASKRPSMKTIVEIPNLQPVIIKILMI